MSEQNRTAPRWQDVVIPLVQSERARLEEHLAWTRQLPVTTETARAFREHEGARIQARIAPLDAALARLAEPEPAAERWRAVPAHAREALIAALETDCDELASAFGVNSAGKPWADHRAAGDALLELAREAEGGGR